MKFSRNTPRRSGGGFTLIEVMIVVVILSVLAALVVPRIMSRPGQARMVRASQDIRAVEAALDLYRLDNFRYPTNEQGLDALVTKPTSPPLAENWNIDGYLKKLPKDPWGAPYQYRRPGKHGSFDLYTLGADQQEGGEGEDADIGNWTLE
ncbi:MAG: type II secretion system major pseudopilin GspG [Gammaproteobacteria bacterium]